MGALGASGWEPLGGRSAGIGPRSREQVRSEGAVLQHSARPRRPEPCSRSALHPFQRRQLTALAWSPAQSCTLRPSHCLMLPPVLVHTTCIKVLSFFYYNNEPHGSGAGLRLQQRRHQARTMGTCRTTRHGARQYGIWWLSEAQHGQAVECTTSSWPCSTQKKTHTGEQECQQSRP